MTGPIPVRASTDWSPIRFSQLSDAAGLGVAAQTPQLAGLSGAVRGARGVCCGGRGCRLIALRLAVRCWVVGWAWLW
ncbi:hypothetical protein I553_3534 [Mycobacterium xenopi 4042]|uniref:Uncharacterized protein n=1 Tax=Mycobacterium xenopi 4042 TaxID=1299334 RepID=X8ANY4_MYCXE|nr:hypothetical protein I553_3534 [Mycobacterium xenopi 4042]